MKKTYFTHYLRVSYGMLSGLPYLSCNIFIISYGFSTTYVNFLNCLAGPS